MDTIKAVVNILIRDGKIERPVTGIEYIGAAQAAYLGMDLGCVTVEDSPEHLPLRTCSTNRAYNIMYNV